MVDIHVGLGYKESAPTVRWDYVKMAEALRNEQKAPPFREKIERESGNYITEAGYNDTHDML
eukprot:4856120-Pyramimonas_sp.AAC.1